MSPLLNTFLQSIQARPIPDCKDSLSVSSFSTSLFFSFLLIIKQKFFLESKNKDFLITFSSNFHNLFKPFLSLLILACISVFDLHSR